MQDATHKEEYYNELLTRANDSDRFAARVGVRILEVREGYAKGDLPNTPATQNLFGGIHGGALSTLADNVSGMAVASLGPFMRVTVHNTMEYLRPAAPGPVQCLSKVRKAGKTIVVCEATITDSEGQEIAIGTFSFYRTEQKI